MWRYHGQIPPFEGFVANLYTDVHAQFVIRLESGQPIGHVVGYAANLQGRHVHLGIVLAETTKGSRYGVPAMSLFIDYLFAVWDFKGIFAETPDFVASPLEASGRTASALPFVETGRRPDYHYFNGRYYDDKISYLSREAWTNRLAPKRLVLGVGPTAI
jgi:RimJ/RimL family protein N-acetyltransferase